MKKKKWNYVREYYEDRSGVINWRYRFRFNDKKAEEVFMVFDDGLGIDFKWVRLTEDMRKSLIKNIEPDGEDYRLKKDGQQ